MLQRSVQNVEAVDSSHMCTWVQVHRISWHCIWTDGNGSCCFSPSVAQNCQTEWQSQWRWIHDPWRLVVRLIVLTMFVTNMADWDKITCGVTNQYVDDSSSPSSKQKLIIVHRYKSRSIPYSPCLSHIFPPNNPHLFTKSPVHSGGKDSYLVLDKLPPEYDSRVKAMEVATSKKPP